MTVLADNKAPKLNDKRFNHYVNLSLAGGESNMFFKTDETAPDVTSMPGCDAMFMFSYEIRKSWLFFGLGAQADYDYTWQKVGEFSDDFKRTDREAEPVIYGYHFSDYRDRQHNLQLSVPLYIGANLGRHAYVFAGAKVSISFLAIHHTTTMLSTDGTYVRFIHTIKDAPTYGYYAADEYTYTAPFDASLKVSPLAEAGVRIPVKSKSGRVGMRLGAYAEYGIPLSWNNQMDLVDYRLVDKNPHTQNQQQLRSSIVFNSVINAAFRQNPLSQLSAGLRWTVLFNITPPEHICMCDADF